jgi:hypothetical protein
MQFGAVAKLLLGELSGKPKPAHVDSEPLVRFHCGNAQVPQTKELQTKPYVFASVGRFATRRPLPVASMVGPLVV